MYANLLLLFVCFANNEEGESAVCSVVESASYGRGVASWADEGTLEKEGGGLAQS